MSQAGGQRRPFFRRKKTCPFSGANAPRIDYKDVKLLQRFISERGKIVPSRITAVSTRKQRVLALAQIVVIEVDSEREHVDGKRVGE